MCHPPCCGFRDSVVFSPPICSHSVPVTAYFLGEQSIRCSPNQNLLCRILQHNQSHQIQGVIFSRFSIYFFPKHIFDRLYFHFWKRIVYCFFCRESPMDISFPFKFWAYSNALQLSFEIFQVPRGFIVLSRLFLISFSIWRLQRLQFHRNIRDLLDKNHHFWI